MPHVENPAHVRFKFWLTPEATGLISRAAAQQGIVRGVYIQRAIHDRIKDLGEFHYETLFPTPRYTNEMHKWQRQYSPGANGRWTKWNQNSVLVHRSVPITLSRLAEAEGLGSATALVRDALAQALKRDLGVDAPMPPSLSASVHFGGKVNQEIV